VTGPHQMIRIAGEGSHWHFHKEMELTLFTKGEGTRFVGDNIGFFTAGDLVLLGENLPHYWHTRGNCSGVSIQWHFPASHPFWALPENLALGSLFKGAGRGIHLTGKTAGTVSKLLLELPEKEGHAQLALMMCAISTIATAPPTDRTHLSVQSFSLTTEDQHQASISRAVQHMIANFRDEIRLEDVMHVSDMSRATFARRFKGLTGHSFSEFLNKLRLQAARRELRETKRPVVDIAFASGFTQLSFFNRLFRRQLDCSPSEYRARHPSPGAR
jgi:AraC-like DNA-binding protein